MNNSPTMSVRTSSAVGQLLVRTPSPVAGNAGAAANAGPRKFWRGTGLALLTLLATLALPLRAHDIYTSWTEAVVHDGRLELTLTLARASAVRLLPDAHTLPPITSANFAGYLPRLKAAAPGLFEIISADKTLKLVSAEATISGDNDIVFRLTFPAAAAGTLRFTANYLFQLVDGHVGTLVITDVTGRDLGWSPVTVDQPKFETKFGRPAHGK